MQNPQSDEAKYQLVKSRAAKPPLAYVEARHALFQQCPNLTRLPEQVIARKIEIIDCPKLAGLPAGLTCNELIAKDSGLTSLPDDLHVEYHLDLSGSSGIERLPVVLKVPRLSLAGCSSLRELPEGLQATYLDLGNCAMLREWPKDIRIGCGHLNLSGTNFDAFPPGVRELVRLDLRGCARLKELPEGLVVRSWVDVAGSALTSLPESMRRTVIRWRGVRINPRIAFDPDSLTEDEILAETNVEVRRVMLERFGFDKFFEAVKAEELDKDRDPGGERRLLRKVLPNDEPLVCITMSCPSTQRRYVLRVPPGMETCRQAAAWLAGFDDPALYDPLIET